MPFFLLSSFAFCTFLVAALSLARLFVSASSPDAGNSGFGDGSSCTGPGGESKSFGLPFSRREIARKNGPIHASNGYVGSDDGFAQNGVLQLNLFAHPNYGLLAAP